MTNQGIKPDPETQSDEAARAPISRTLEIRSHLSGKRAGVYEHAWRRRYLAVLGVLLGCLVASALITGLVKGLKGYHDPHITGAQPLSAGLAGEGFCAMLTSMSRPATAFPLNLSAGTSQMSLLHCSRLCMHLQVCIEGNLQAKRPQLLWVLRTARALAGNTISKGYVPPVNKQGIHDQRFYDAVSACMCTYPSMLSGFMYAIVSRNSCNGIFFQPSNSVRSQTPAIQPLGNPVHTSHFL